MKLSFSKYQGAGNDFILIDNRIQGFVPDEKIVSKLCTRHTGIGADGLIILESHETYDFSMRYFNADGKEATLCGNGGRCAIAFARSLGICKEKTSFMAVDGKHEGIIEKAIIRLRMQDVHKINKINKDYFLDTGSPHFVTFVKDVKNYPVFREGKKIRYSTPFQPEGTNVNFVEVLNETTLFNRTYERGVEDETLSCGTGSVAAALAFTKIRHNVRVPVTVITKGGTLKISFQEELSGIYHNIWLEGPATFVFSGIVEITDLFVSG